LVATKSIDTEKAAKELYDTFGSNNDTKYILFQNGWGNAEIFSPYFMQKNIYNARVITGFCRPEVNEVKITVHSDDIKIGSIFNKVDNDIKYICNLITKGGIVCSLSEDIKKDLWAKMLYNCALNPLGAIFGVCYGELAKNNNSRDIMEKIIKEIFCVMKKSGYMTYWENENDYIRDFYEKILPPTYDHEASMLQDINSKKLTEIDYLNGAIVKLGKKYDVEISINDMIVKMIKFIESK